jgi:5-methylcytosine-specific restriction endonuclease McrBC regulatory subunit McrC
VTPAERLRQHQRTLAKAQRELDRERSKLEQQEKKLVMDIKKSAKLGQMVRHFHPFLVSLCITLVDPQPPVCMQGHG